MEKAVGFTSTQYKIENPSEPAATLLTKVEHGVEPYNGPFLAGLAPEPNHGYVELTPGEYFDAAQPHTPATWTEEDTAKVIGDLSDTIQPGSTLLLVCTPDVQEATAYASSQGYVPVRAGQFVQALWWIKTELAHVRLGGYFFCYEGRRPQYAVLATYNNLGLRPQQLSLSFDTYVDDDVVRGYLHTNWEVYLMFVKSP